MRTADGEFRDFVAGFADPLTRLAVILAATSLADIDAAERLVARALSRVKRRWRDVAGMPEQHAVETLLSLMPRGLRPPAIGAIGAQFEISADDDPIAVRNIKAALWQAWCELAPRHRIPIVFNDIAVVSPRLESAELPDGASARKRAKSAREALALLRDALAADDRVGTDNAADPANTADAGNVIEQWLPATLAEMARRVPAPLDMVSRVDNESRRLRGRSAIAATAVIAVIGAGSAAAVQASRPDRPAAPLASHEPVAINDRVGSAGPTPRVAAKATQLPVERGFADANVLAAALAAAHRWQASGAFGSSAHPVVVWGGVDDAHDIGVVLRMASPQLSDLVVVTWLSDVESGPRSRAYRVDSASSDLPFAFFYAARDGLRVGVVAPREAAKTQAKARLTVDGVALPTTPVDSAGFVSLAVRGQSGLLAEQSIDVQLLAPSGKSLSQPFVPAQPMVGGGDG